MSIDDFDFGSSDFDFGRVTSNFVEDDMFGITEDDDGLELPLIRGANEVRHTGLDDDESSDKEDTTAYIHVTGTAEDIVALSKPTTPKLIPETTKGTSKMAVARAIYAREAAKGPIIRKNIIALFMSEAGCTTAGAATYYATIHTK